MNLAKISQTSHQMKELENEKVTEHDKRKHPVFERF